MKINVLQQATAAAPELHACVNCPVNFVCCSVAAKGGVVEPPYLMPADISAISEATGLQKEEFVESRRNPVTGNFVWFVSPPEGHGCRFHDSASGKCSIYNARPLDCRLYPLDILLKDGNYYWILWQYCEITEEDLEALVAYGQSVLLSMMENLLDFASVPLETMDKNPYRIIRQIQF